MVQQLGVSAVVLWLVSNLRGPHRDTYLTSLTPTSGARRLIIGCVAAIVGMPLTALIARHDLGTVSLRLASVIVMDELG